MNHSFFQVAVVSILLYRCSTWTLTKRMEKKLDGNYTRMLRAILNRSWRQHPTKQQQYGHLPPSRKLSKLDEPDMQDTGGEVGTSDVLCGPLHMVKKKQGHQLEPTYSRYRKQWTIGRGGDKGSEMSVRMAQHDDDDDEIISQKWVHPSHLWTFFRYHS